MASSGDADIGQLSPGQQTALEQYTQVTAQDVKDAIPLLQRSQWNVQIAVAKFFDGEGPDPIAEAVAAQNDVPRQPARHENLQESLASSGPFGGRPLPRARPDPAPRIVPQPQTMHRPPWPLAILFAGFNLGYRAASSFFRTFMYVFMFLPASVRPRALTTSMTSGWKGTMGRRMLMPRDTAARFKREFEEEYGDTSLPFYEGGFAQALDLTKKELKFLLIVLMSPEHDDTESFTRETLLSPDVVAFVADPASDMVLWGGNVLDSEAYQVAAEYNCTKFPFSCLVCLTPKEGSTRMSIVKRLVGPMPPAAYLAELRAAAAKYAPDLAAARAERTANEVARNLRTEQDSAYERSLARDRERARQRREAEAEAREAEIRAKREAEAAELRQRQRRQWRRWRASVLPPEPDAGGGEVVRLALKMPRNDRVVRRFAAAATVEELYAFVECYDVISGTEDSDDDDELDEKQEYPPRKPEGYVHEYKFRIASPLPRVVYEPDEAATLRDTIGRSGNLIVEDVMPDEDEDDDDEVDGVEA
ncbi:UBX domain-containing protein [Hypoxylon sp. FL1284]|nr:UBX domain-containing protein [Hypoxylon sp. FL1284]